MRSCLIKRTVKALTCASIIFTICDLYSLDLSTNRWNGLINIPWVDYDINFTNTTLDSTDTPTTTWTGEAGDSLWITAANWTNAVPTEKTIAILGSNAVNVWITEPANVWTIAMAQEAAMVIDKSQTLTMAGTMPAFDRGKIILSSDAAMVSDMMSTSITNGGQGGSSVVLTGGTKPTVDSGITGEVIIKVPVECSPMQMAFSGSFMGVQPVWMGGCMVISGDNSGSIGGFVLDKGASLGIDGTKALPSKVSLGSGSSIIFYVNQAIAPAFTFNGDAVLNIATEKSVTVQSGAAFTNPAVGQPVLITKTGSGALNINAGVKVGSDIVFEVKSGTLRNNTLIPVGVAVDSGGILGGNGIYGEGIKLAPGGILQVGSSQSPGVVSLLPGAVLYASGEVMVPLTADGSFSGIKGIDKASVSLSPVSEPLEMPSNASSISQPRSIKPFGWNAQIAAAPLDATAASLAPNGSVVGKDPLAPTGAVVSIDPKYASLVLNVPTNFVNYGKSTPVISVPGGTLKGNFASIGGGGIGLVGVTAQTSPDELSITIAPISAAAFLANFGPSLGRNALQAGTTLIQSIDSTIPAASSGLSVADPTKPVPIEVADPTQPVPIEIADPAKPVPIEAARVASMRPLGAPALLAASPTLAASGSSASTNNLTNAIWSSLLYLPDTNALEEALNQLQPSLYKGMIVVQENNAVKVQNTLFYRFEQELNEVFCQRLSKGSDESDTNPCAKKQKNFHVWGSGFGDSLHQKSTYFAGSAQTGYNSNTGGVTIGVDQRFAKWFYVGALGGYTGSSINWTSHQGNGSLDTGYAGLYLSGISDMFYGNLSVIGGWSSYDAHRNITYGVVDERAKTNHGGSQILTHADTGINIGFKGFTIRPFDAFDYIAQTENGFTEHGAGIYNLKVKKSNSVMLRNELGLQFAGCMCFGHSRWTISPKISWVREVRTKGKSYQAKFVDTDNYATYTGYFPDRSLASSGVLLSGLMWKDRLALDLYYNGEFAHNYADHNYGGEIRFGF